MSERRNDRELADVMRKLLASDAFLGTTSGPRHGGYTFTIDDTTVEVTEGELQAITEEGDMAFSSSVAR